MTWEKVKEDNSQGFVKYQRGGYDSIIFYTKDKNIVIDTLNESILIEQADLKFILNKSVDLFGFDSNMTLFELLKILNIDNFSKYMSRILSINKTISEERMKDILLQPISYYIDLAVEDRKNNGKK